MYRKVRYLHNFLGPVKNMSLLYPSASLKKKKRKRKYIIVFSWGFFLALYLVLL
jgi:hypothetical protein